MMISGEWSVPMPITFGKDISVHTSVHFVEAMVSNADASITILKKATPATRGIQFLWNEFSHIPSPFLSFRTENNEAHVEVEFID
jgi:hypothetical protein